MLSQLNFCDAGRAVGIHYTFCAYTVLCCVPCCGYTLYLL